MNSMQLNSIADCVWEIADDVLKEPAIRGKFRDIILPMIVIRRFDALLEPTKQAVLDMKEQLDKSRVVNQEAALCQCAKQVFYNTSPFTLRELVARAHLQTFASDFEAYVDGFSSNVQGILQKFDMKSQIPRLAQSEILGSLIERFLDRSINVSPNPVCDAHGLVVLPGLDNQAMGALFEELVRRFDQETLGGVGGPHASRDISVGSDETQKAGMKYSCPCCKTTFPEFIPISEQWRLPIVVQSRIYEMEDYEGGDAMEVWSCPVCRSNPRTRLYYLYLEDYFNHCSGDISLLHIAPEKQLQGLILSQKNVSYRSMDLVGAGVDDHCDIRNMSLYPDAHFDFVICSQVLEHVERDVDRALQELHRVISLEGKAIISVPFIKGLDCTYEDEAITTPEGRKRAYGDETHYRIYGRKDFVQKLNRMGFVVEDMYAKDLCSCDRAKKLGISPDTTCFIVTKQA